MLQAILSILQLLLLKVILLGNYVAIASYLYEGPEFSNSNKQSTIAVLLFLNFSYIKLCAYLSLILLKSSLLSQAYG